MIFRRQLSGKGQLVIPKDIREILKLKKGETVTIEVKEDEVILKKEQNLEEFLKDFLNTPKLKKRIPWKKMKKELGDRYEVH